MQCVGGVSKTRYVSCFCNAYISNTALSPIAPSTCSTSTTSRPLDDMHPIDDHIVSHCHHDELYGTASYIYLHIRILRLHHGTSIASLLKPPFLLTLDSQHSITRHAQPPIS